MIKIFKLVGAGILVTLISLILWMNLTPGHFQKPEGCACRARYYTKEQVGSLPLCICAPNNVIVELSDQIKLMLAELDFNK